MSATTKTKKTKTKVKTDVELGFRHYQVRAGTHVEGAPGEERVYKTGEVVMSRQPLDQMFKNKFTVVGEIPTVDLQAIDPKMDELLQERQAQRARQMLEGKFTPAPLEEGSALAARAKKAALAARGRNVSEEFPEANDAELLVFKRDKLFHVHRKGVTKALNSEGLKRSKVAGFVAEYLEG